MIRFLGIGVIDIGVIRFSESWLGQDSIGLANLVEKVRRPVFRTENACSLSSLLTQVLRKEVQN